MAILVDARPNRTEEGGGRAGVGLVLHVVGYLVLLPGPRAVVADVEVQLAVVVVVPESRARRELRVGRQSDTGGDRHISEPARTELVVQEVVAAVGGDEQ